MPVGFLLRIGKRKAKGVRIEKDVISIGWILPKGKIRVKKKNK